MIQTVDIVIPTYNGRDLLEKNLPSVVQACRVWASSAPKENRQARIYVVDDASTDGTAEALCVQFSESVVVVRSTKRGGVGRSLHRGTMSGDGEIILSLNNDIRVEADFLEPLLEPFDNPGVFAVSARILRTDASGKKWINQSGQCLFYEEGRIRTRILDHEVMEKVTSLVEIPGGCATCAAFRRSVYEKIGGINPVFSPFYWEDVDLFYRAMKRGFRIMYQPGSTVYHEHSVTVKREYTTAQVERIFWRNYLIFNGINISDDRFLAEFRRYVLGLIVRCVRHRTWWRLAGIVDAISHRHLIAERRAIEKANLVIQDEVLWQRFTEWEARILAWGS